jgi:uncharacterized membrane protein YkoI
MRTFLPWAVRSALAFLLLAIVVQADEKAKKIPLDKVPKVIMDAINGRFPGADISSVEKETEEGKVAFDVELKHQGRKYEMDIQENGTITEIEKEVALKDAPRGLARTIRAKFPKAKIKEVMEVNKVSGSDEKPVHYEVTITTADNKTREVVVSLDGKTLKQQGKDKD